MLGVFGLATESESMINVVHEAMYDKGFREDVKAAMQPIADAMAQRYSALFVGSQFDQRVEVQDEETFECKSDVLLATVDSVDVQYSYGEFHIFINWSGNASWGPVVGRIKVFKKEVM